MLRILGRTGSINVRKVLWTCHEIGLDYQREDWGRGFRPLSDPDFVALNPHALIPVLQDGATVLWESNAICRYLAAKHGRDDLLPVDAAARARVEMWMDWQRSLDDAGSYAFHALWRQSPDHREPARIAASVESFNRLMARLDGVLAAGGPYLAAERFTLADLVVGLSAQRWALTPFDKPSLPALEAYRQRLIERPAFAAHGSAGLA